MPVVIPSTLQKLKELEEPYEGGHGQSLENRMRILKRRERYVEYWNQEAWLKGNSGLSKVNT